MPILVQCGQCRSQFHAPDQLAGQQVACTNCQAPILIPAPTPPQPTPQPTLQPLPQLSPPAAAPVFVVCPGCQAKFEAPPHLYGKQVACPSCSTAIQVPMAAAPATFAAPTLTPTPTNPDPQSSALDAVFGSSISAPAGTQPTGPSDSPFAGGSVLPTPSPTGPGRHPEKGRSTRLASRGERFVGAFVDGVIMYSIVVAILYVLALILGPLWITNPVYRIASSLIGPAVFLALNGYLLANQGQTIGKLVVGARIVSDKNGRILPMGELIGKRYLPIWLIVAIPSLVMVPALMLLVMVFLSANYFAIFRRNRHCIHDDFANTSVIKVR